MKKWLLSKVLGVVLGTMLLALANPAGAAEPFFFIQLSDPQFGMFTGNKDFVQETANYEFAAATVNRLRPKFVIITGDLVNKPGDAAQIAEYKRITAKINTNIPVYHVAGNHDVENVPTPARLTEFTNHFGPDRFTFREGGFAGIVLNSSVIHSPQQATNELAAQELWLREELKWIQDEQVNHIVVFQHHPWFLKAADEPDQYFNIPLERRTNYLALFRESGVKYLFSGHYHRNAVARDGSMEAITTGPVGQPLGDDKSGLRVVIVRDNGLEHRYFHFGEVPNRIDPKRPLNKTTR
jgi:3',5'-cyclic AMP phosphodiesterase CpdA